MAIFRANHIKPQTIAMVPQHGYVTNVKFSTDSIRWMDFIAYKENIQIRHALNGRGEVNIEGHFVDGFCEATNTIYQYHVSFSFITNFFCLIFSLRFY